ncbi:MAG: rhamnogalacturonan acetylesterase [Cytophagaceae bacterium]|nr:rhamnogalacturonan acetylesterase [Cytophagaceae bacterium]
MKYLILYLTLIFFTHKPKPILFLIGDSTVKTGQGKGENDMWGWGSKLGAYFDATKINIENHAIGGRSSRTFLTDGRWEPILVKMKKGDFLMIQFGHNDDWAINDTIRARGTIKGIGKDSVEIDNLITKKHEVVHSFGWYLRKYIVEARAKGVEVFVCSPVPFCRFENGKVQRKAESFPFWARQVSEQTQAHFIDLHEITAKHYDKLGPEEVKKQYFTPKDNVHTNALGAEINAQSVVKGLIRIKKSKLRKYLL